MNKKYACNDDECIIDEFIVDKNRTYDLVYTRVNPSAGKMEETNENEWIELSFEDRYIKNLLEEKERCQKFSFW